MNNNYNNYKSFIFLVNADWFFLSHRLDLALKVKKRGYKVYVVCRDTGSAHKIIKHGLNYIELKISRSGINFFKELQILFKTIYIYKKINPMIVQHVSLKCVIYGSISSILTGIPSKVINVITGLGYVFINKSIINNILRKLFFIILKNFSNQKFINVFQNKNEMNFFIKKNVVKKERSVLIKGSGVNVNKFNYSSIPDLTTIKFILPARLLFDKGLEEYAEASFLIQKKYPGYVQCLLAGRIDYDNKNAVDEKTIKKWELKKEIIWLGDLSAHEMIKQLKNCHVVVLPSYHEGLPKSLVEAGSIGRASIATNVNGCNEIIKNNVNGLLIKVRDATSLFEAMEYFIDNPKKIKSYGLKARKIVESEYSSEIIINQYLNLYER